VNIRRYLLRKFSKPVKLKKWLELGDLRGTLDADDMCLYLEKSLGKNKWGEIKWIEFMEDYVFAVELNQPKQEFPIFSVEQKDKESRYKTDTWYIWANVIAKAYGWKLEYIANLDVETGIGIIQEILYDEQTSKEWEWGLSDRSIGYKDKQSYFIPYEKPEWMRPPIETTFVEPKKVKIRKDMLPVGPVMTWKKDA